MPDPARKSPFVLGTAQLGSAYGVANRIGAPSEGQAMELLELAWNCGIRDFDTAASYGNSEEILGRFFRSLGDDRELVRVCTKAQSVSGLSSDEVVEFVESRRERLGLECIDSVLLHTEAEADQLGGLYGETMSQLQRDGVVRAFGVSFYDPDLALRVIEAGVASAIQIPSNAFDSRWWKGGVLSAAKQKSLSVNIRSVYLQGLLLMAAEEAPEVVSGARGILRCWEKFCSCQEIEKPVAAVAYVQHFCPDAKLILGCETQQQLLENLSILTAAREVPRASIEEWQAMVPAMPDNFLNPGKWSRAEP